VFNGTNSGADAEQAIQIYGAREHNLKNLSLSIPRNQFVVITGVSGSGKSTLAFDLLFAEGQRRFLDSMNAYARQFVEQLARPDVDLITGIPPTVSIEQRNSRGGGKSTVATVTEVYHFLRLLFARLGTQFCPQCAIPVEAQTRDALGRRLRAELKQRGDLLLLAPVVKNRKGFHTEVAEWAAKHGYAEIRADGKMYATADRVRLDRFREHNVEIVVGVLESKSRRAAASQKTSQQLIDETLELGHGTLLALGNDTQVSIHSTERACPHCGQSFEPLDPKNFSYNSSQGWCQRCRGFGELFYLPEVDRGARADAIEESWFEWQDGKREPCPECQGSRLNPVARAVRLSAGRPIPVNNPAKVSRGRERRAPEGSQALSPETAATIDAISNASVEEASAYFRALKPRGRAAEVARDILPEINERLKFLREVGLGYLQLGRSATTLSGGEAQRIRLAAQLGSNLSGVLYVLDEPTIGLHARDNEQLLAALSALKARGNSLVVVEHDEQTMRQADYIIDLGPGAGVRGGQVVASGTLAELMGNEESITGQCLRSHKQYPARGQRRPVRIAADLSPRPLSSVGKATRSKTLLKSGGSEIVAQSDARTPCLILSHARSNNLKDLTVAFPLNRLVVVTGVSGSGKSTLVRDCLLPAIQAVVQKNGKSSSRKTARNLQGFESIKAVYEVDQSPIGRTPRSIPATYVGFFDEIRLLYSLTPEARLRGYSPSRFSFNSNQGRCPACEGAGTIKLEMNFMPPAYVRCETCQGTRFNLETLDIQHREKNIAQVLELSVAEAMDFFASFQKIRRPLEALRDTGLDYLKLGQISPTLSGGEAQRIKLVTHLLTGLVNQKAAARLPTKADAKLKAASMGKAGQTDSSMAEPARPTASLFILEEPTIGLHIADVKRLVEVLQRLVEAGHSVIVIEHNLDLIAEADWVIDLGPEGGEGGGRLVAEGTPEHVAQSKHSHTGRFLRSMLAKA
jgi:excinuclease ABC subunit A